MKRGLICALLAGLALTGCQNAGRQDTQLNTKSMESRKQIVRTLEQVSAPSMAADIMNKTDAEVVAWIKQLDLWTNQVLSSSVTGGMDRHGAKAVREKLQQVYSKEMADRLIANFFYIDRTTSTYRARSTDQTLGLRSEWRGYQLSKVQPSANIYTIQLLGMNNRDAVGMMHNSEYKAVNGKLIVTQFETSS